MTVYVERMADSLAEPVAERVAVDKGMETEPTRKKDQDEENCDENQKTNTFHANEISDYGLELIFVAGRRFSRLFGDLGAIASRVV